MNFPSDLETLALLTFRKVDDYLMASWPNGAGEFRVIGNSLGVYEYSGAGAANLIELKVLG